MSSCCGSARDTAWISLCWERGSAIISSRPTAATRASSDGRPRHRGSPRPNCPVEAGHERPRPPRQYDNDDGARRGGSISTRQGQPAAQNGRPLGDPRVGIARRPASAIPRTCTSGFFSFFRRSRDPVRRLWLDLGDLGVFVRSAGPLERWQDHGLGLLRTIMRDSGVDTHVLSLRSLRSWDQLPRRMAGYDQLFLNVRSYTFPLACRAAELFNGSTLPELSSLAACTLPWPPKKWSACRFSIASVRVLARRRSSILHEIRRLFPEWSSGKEVARCPIGQ